MSAAPHPARRRFAWVEERGDQENKVFVVVLSADEAGREKDVRSFGVDGGGRYDPVRQKAERFAERINSTFSARLRPLVEALIKIADMPVIDFCGDLCTKWQPSELAFKALKEFDNGK